MKAVYLVLIAFVIYYFYEQEKSKNFVNSVAPVYGPQLPPGGMPVTNQVPAPVTTSPISVLGQGVGGLTYPDVNGSDPQAPLYGGITGGISGVFVI